MEQRRMRAADLLERGLIPADIARQVGVAHQVVSEWRKAWRQGGREALRSAGPAGRKSRLTDAQFTQVRNALIKGAEANGYSTDVWTVPRVAEVIEHVTGVSYHPGHVWYLLHEQLDWTWQRQRDEPKNATTPPFSSGSRSAGCSSKTARRQNALIVFEDDSGVSLLPSVGTT